MKSINRHTGTSLWERKLIQVKLQRLFDKYLLITHQEGTWEIIHGDPISSLQRS